MKPIKQVTLVRNRRDDGWCGNHKALSQILGRGGRPEDVFVCDCGLDEMVIVPVRAKKLHIQIFKEPPKTGAWFTLSRTKSFFDASGKWYVQINEVNSATDNLSRTPFTHETDYFLIHIMKQHKIKICYALIEWS